MNLFSRILAELETPDDQKNSWYDWSCSQMSHALLGVIVGLYFPIAGLQTAAIIASLKECFDIAKVPSLRTIKDSAVDISFWVLGAFLVAPETDKNAAVILLCFALLCGVIPRARKALK